MYILVTGGAGFIGSHFLELLLKNGHECICIDNFDDYYDYTLKIRNLDHCNEYKDLFYFIRGDIRDEETYKKLRELPKPDIVFHFAARAGVRGSINDPTLYYDVNIMGTLQLLEYCRMMNINRFVFASSSSIYGNNKKVPFTEQDMVDNPISPYAATKKACELLIHTYTVLYGIAGMCLRLFTVYGPRQRPEMAIHNFVRKISKEEPVFLFGDGSSERDYTYISDIVNTIYTAMYRTVGYQVINIGGGRTTSLNALIAIIEKEVGKKAKIEYLSDQPGDVRKTYADISLATMRLHYTPKVGIEEGIAKFVEWYNARNT